MRSKGTVLTEGKIADADSHKYLHFPQANENHGEATMKADASKYLQRVRQGTRPGLSTPTPCQSSDGIMWPKDEIDATDIKTGLVLHRHCIQSGRKQPKD